MTARASSLGTASSLPGTAAAPREAYFTIGMQADVMKYSRFAPPAVVDAVAGALESGCGVRVQRRVDDRTFKYTGFPFMAFNMGPVCCVIYTALEALNVTVLSSSAAGSSSVFYCRLNAIPAVPPTAPFALMLGADLVCFACETAPVRAVIQEALNSRLVAIGYKIQKPFRPLPLDVAVSATCVKLKGFPLMDDPSFFIVAVISVLLEMGCQLVAAPSTGCYLFRPPVTGMSAPSSKVLPPPACFAVVISLDSLAANGIEAGGFQRLVEGFAASWATGALGIQRMRKNDNTNTMTVQFSGFPWHGAPGMHALNAYCAAYEMLGSISGQLFMSNAGLASVVVGLYSCPGRAGPPVGRGTARMLRLTADVLAASGNSSPPLVQLLGSACANISDIQVPFQAVSKRFCNSRASLVNEFFIKLRGYPFAEDPTGTLDELVGALLSGPLPGLEVRACAPRRPCT